MDKRMLFRRIVCLMITGAGIDMYFSGIDGRYGAEVPKFVAILFSFVGVYIFIYSFFVTKKDGRKKGLLCDTEDMICEKCKEIYKTVYVQIPVCPKCDGRLVEYKESINNDFDKLSKY